MIHTALGHIIAMGLIEKQMKKKMFMSHKSDLHNNLEHSVDLDAL